MMAASDPSDIQLVAPALLQLNRGDKAVPFEPCPSPTCGVPITTFPDCVECRHSSNLNLKCDSCWTDCASPCNDDDCHIPQPCYDEHCAVESCVDSECVADSCTDGTCPETVHCNATCFDTDCVYSFGDDATSYDGQECEHGHCFGFLPVGPGLDSFSSSHDMLFQCPQVTSPHSTTSGWNTFGMQEQGFQHDHVNQSNRHKRRRLQPDAPYTMQSSQIWSDDQFDGMFSSDALDMALNHTLPSNNAFSASFDFNGQCANHQYFKPQQNEWAGLTSSLPCHPPMEKCSHFHIASHKQKRGHENPPKILPAPSLAGLTSGRSVAYPTHLQSDGQEAELDLICRWVTDSANGAICGHHFTCAKDLDDHLQKAHTSKLGPQEFVCRWEGCDTTFKHRGKLNRHISGAHSKYHAYVCDHIDPVTSEPCGRTFCTKEQLKNHETTHTGERKYKCRYCNHTSATKTQHNTHERIHTKEKPYKCPWCGHRSGDSSNLSKHVRNKHPGMAGRAKKSASVEALGGLCA